MRAVCNASGRRQVRPMQPPLDVHPLVEEIVSLILANQEDHRSKWNKDGSVMVRPGKFIPAGSVVRQTLQGRRRRFREALKERLAQEGWREIKLNTYKRESQI